MDPKEIRITEEYLKQLVDYVSSSLVGKLMKRFEILEDKNDIKASAKELIYEEMRTFRKLLLSYQEGRELVEFKFKSNSQSK